MGDKDENEKDKVENEGVKDGYSQSKRVYVQLLPPLRVAGMVRVSATARCLIGNGKDCKYDKFEIRHGEQVKQMKIHTGKRVTGTIDLQKGDPFLYKSCTIQVFITTNNGL